MDGHLRMGRWRGPRYDGGVRRYLSPRCIGMHVTLLVVLPLFAWLTWWQLTRAESGNSLSWAYVVLWPAFAVYAALHVVAAHPRPGCPGAGPAPLAGRHHAVGGPNRDVRWTGRRCARAASADDPGPARRDGR